MPIQPGIGEGRSRAEAPKRPPELRKVPAPALRKQAYALGDSGLRVAPRYSGEPQVNGKNRERSGVSGQKASFSITEGGKKSVERIYEHDQKKPVAQAEFYSSTNTPSSIEDIQRAVIKNKDGDVVKQWERKNGGVVIREFRLDDPDGKKLCDRTITLAADGSKTDHIIIVEGAVKTITEQKWDKDGRLKSETKREERTSPDNPRKTDITYSGTHNMYDKDGALFSVTRESERTTVESKRFRGQKRQVHEKTENTTYKHADSGGYDNQKWEYKYTSNGHTETFTQNYNRRNIYDGSTDAFNETVVTEYDTKGNVLSTRRERKDYDKNGRLIVDEPQPPAPKLPDAAPARQQLPTTTEPRMDRTPLQPSATPEVRFRSVYATDTARLPGSPAPSVVEPSSVNKYTPREPLPGEVNGEPPRLTPEQIGKFIRLELEMATRNGNEIAMHQWGNHLADWEQRGIVPDRITRDYGRERTQKDIDFDEAMARYDAKFPPQTYYAGNNDNIRIAAVSHELRAIGGMGSTVQTESASVEPAPATKIDPLPARPEPVITQTSPTVETPATASSTVREGETTYDAVKQEEIQKTFDTQMPEWAKKPLQGFPSENTETIDLGYTLITKDGTADVTESPKDDLLGGAQDIEITYKKPDGTVSATERKTITPSDAGSNIRSRVYDESGKTVIESRDETYDPENNLVSAKLKTVKDGVTIGKTITRGTSEDTGINSYVVEEKADNITRTATYDDKKRLMLEIQQRERDVDGETVKDIFERTRTYSESGILERETITLFDADGRKSEQYVLDPLEGIITHLRNTGVGESEEWQTAA